MSAGVWELLDLVARWVHVIAGIMWIGNSLLFNWLDRNLRPTAANGPSKPIGTIWLLHSGAFYYVEKTLLDGQTLPRPLHWFKWQAYSTWLSGMVLLLVVYYLSDRAVLADPSVANLSHGAAVLVGLGSIVGGWIVYESMQRFVAPRTPGVAAAIWIVLLVAIIVALTQLLSGRAAFLHVGAMLGTIMAGNVFFTIVPSQRALVASIGVDAPASAALSARAKRVSIYNNYVTFPVIALMVSNHFPTMYGHRWNWLLLLAIIAAGAAVRHVLNVRFNNPRWKAHLAATMTVSVAVLYVILALPGRASTSASSESSAAVAAVATQAITFADARHVIDRRCAVCHSVQPVDLAFSAAPAGVTFDTPDQIVARAARIQERAVVTRTMPPANKTHITDVERAILRRWIELGATTK
ncbi:MAG TPA: urate hydroxylase PuuD [Gemmatimonadaceae bacterium]|nr:urate hydroxylase PuuD [Gemmatimonadaceae bacterium]